MSGFTCQMSNITFKMHIFKEKKKINMIYEKLYENEKEKNNKVDELVVGGSIINGATTSS